MPSWLARLLTLGARWGHCGIYDVERGVVIEALLIRGVVETPIETWYSRYPYYTQVGIDCPDADKALNFARLQVGKPYDYLGAFSVPWRTSWNDLLRWYCSELVEAALAAGGRLRWRLTKHGISPTESWLVL